MDMFWILLLAVNLVLSIIVSDVAKERGRSAGKFFALSFLVSFVVALLVLIALPNTKPVMRSDESALEKCPYCAEYIKVEARVCRFCSRDISKEFEKLAAEHAKQSALLDDTARQAEQALKDFEETVRLNKFETSKRRKLALKRMVKSRLFIAGVVALAVPIVAITVLKIWSFVVSESEKARVQQELVNSTSLQIEDWLEKKQDWTAVLSSCNSKHPSDDLITSAVSSDGIVLSLKFFYSEKSDWYGAVPSSELRQFLECTSRGLRPYSGYNDVLDMVTVGKENQITFGANTYKGKYFYAWTTQGVRVGRDLDPGPFKIEIRKAGDYTGSVKYIFEERAGLLNDE